METRVRDSRPVYLVGNFNSWEAGIQKYRMKKVGDGCYTYTLEHTEDLVQYKYVKGDWGDVEILENGNQAPIRVVTQQTNQIYDEVKNWRKNWKPYKKDFLPIIELVDEDFYIPQLGKSRKVWALLPHNYYENEKKYPVMYLQDAQNLFDEKSPFGNWEIDKKMAVLSEYNWGDVILIAVEHGGEERISEYHLGDPESIEQRGKGKKYIRFMADTLKPFIDQKYRTLPGRENTGIGGSSMGGLISIFGGILYPEVYSKLMIFSPSLWIYPSMKFSIFKFYNPFRTKIYLYGGGKESKSLIHDIYEFKKDLEQAITEEIDLDFKMSFNPEGKHQEYYWSKEFPKAMQWLYFAKTDTH